MGIREAAVARVCALLCVWIQEHESLGADLSIQVCVCVVMHLYVLMTWHGDDDEWIVPRFLAVGLNVCVYECVKFYEY